MNKSHLYRLINIIGQQFKFIEALSKKRGSALVSCCLPILLKTVDWMQPRVIHH